MKKTVRIFQSLQKQEEYHNKLMLDSTVAERFRKLLHMQQMTKLLHPSAKKFRKIQIHKWTS